MKSGNLNFLETFWATPTVTGLFYLLLRILSDTGVTSNLNVETYTALWLFI